MPSKNVFLRIVCQNKSANAFNKRFFTNCVSDKSAKIYSENVFNSM